MIKSLLRAAARLLYRVRVQGSLEALSSPKTLIVANHQSLLDGLLLGLFLPVDATFVVHTGVVKNWLFRKVLGLTDYLLVDPSNPLAMKRVVQLLDSGRTVVIFPEGRITTTGSLTKVYDGSAFVAARTGATIVPVSIQGAAQSPFGYLAKLYPVRWFPRIVLTVSPPQHLERAPGSAKCARRAAGTAMHRMLQEALLAARPQHTLFEALLDAASRFGRKYRVVEDIRGVEETYGTLIRMAKGAAHLLERRTADREVVGVMLPNSIGAVAVILGLSSCRRVPALLNHTAGAAGVRAACRAACVRSVVTSRLFVEKAGLAPLVAELGESGVEVLWMEDLKQAMTAQDKLSIALHSCFPRLGLPPQRPQDAAVVLFTSGSEGSPKGVVHSHDSLLANVAQVLVSADFTPADKFFVALPLFHSFGLTCGTLLPLLSGIRLYLYPTPLHYKVIPELVYDKSASVLFGTSTFLGQYAKFAHPYDFARLRYVIAGAEKLAESVRQTWFSKFGVRVLEGYGATECAPVIAVNTPMGAREGTVGKLLPGMRFRLEDVPGMATGQRLFVEGPNVMLGYYRCERPGVLETASANGEPGWYDTGDIVSLDEDGFVRIQGRAKRFAKVAGEMVSLDAVERLAASVGPDTAASAVVVRADERKGEALVLFTTSSVITREALIEQARRSGVPEIAVPRDIRLLDKLPQLGTGKTDYQALLHVVKEEQ